MESHPFSFLSFCFHFSFLSFFFFDGEELVSDENTFEYKYMKM